MPAPRFLGLVAALSLVLGPAAGRSTAWASRACPSGPAYDAGITPPSMANPGWPFRRATTAELNAYTELVDAQSDRVSGGVFATSWRGTPLRYALVGEAGTMRHPGDVAAGQQRLVDPRRTTRSEADRIARTNPAIVWYTGNVHGNEPSGADAAIQILYELAARTDCAARAMLRNLLVGIIPTQNPDGRDSVMRENAYGFDMNRDWFARTQPETDGKLRLLSRYPPVLYVDAHEQALKNFFFPPNADPIHHEISPQSVDWVNRLYGPALAAAFDQRNRSDPLNWQHFSYDVYDLFYMGYGDTVPTTAFTSAGMTFEKGSADTDLEKEREQFVAGWTALQTASANKRAILEGYYRAHVTALDEGRAGTLEPNKVYEPGNGVKRRVPHMTVRHYFIRADRRFPDAAHLIDRLMRMGVEVYRLDRDVRVPDLQHYGRAAAARTVPAGSYWVPLAQPQKRWIQALMGEDSYVPFPYFYDVTAWSNPLLMNLDASFSGAKLSPSATRLREPPEGAVLGNAVRARFFAFPGDTGGAVAAGFALARAGISVDRLQRAAHGLGAGTFIVPDEGEAALAVRDAAATYRLRVLAKTGAAPRGLPVRQPTIAVYAPPTALPTLGEESLGHLRYLLDQVWHVPYTPLTGVQVMTGALQLGGFDVFVVPGVSTFDLTLAGPQIKSWIQRGGLFVGTNRPGDTGGTSFAVSQGFTSSQLTGTHGMQIPGSLFRVSLSHSSPVTVGASSSAYWFQLGESVLTPSTTGATPGRYPKKAPDFWVSGYASGQRALEGSAALVDERLGSGRVVLFSGEPNYRAYTEGSAFLLANALAYPLAGVLPGLDVGLPAAARAVDAAVASAGRSFGPGRPIRIEVPAAEGSTALAIARRFTSTAWLERSATSSIVVMPNPSGIEPKMHPFAVPVLDALRAGGIDVRSAVL
ncbi:MAG TPA: M14 family zinc carboxypeptidase [Actinomycetota bacterium]|nr:M14 family zinc carboxypeptidase [Actinomycetota bacterium]